MEALDALGDWQDPLGKLEEVVYMVEWPLVFGSEFDERFLRLPERVIVTAMQSHQRYFPLGENRFAVVAAGGDVDVIRPGYTQVLDARLEDAAFTFDRDVAVGIDELAGRLDRITFFEGGGTFAEKTARLVELVGQLGGDEHAREAARLAKADQASELVREFPELEGVIGAEYARLAGYPDDVCVAIAEHYLPDAADAPLPSTPAGRVLSAADRIDTLTVSFSLGHRPTGSRDPYGLRRAAIGLCRLAVEGGVAVPHELLAPDVREFVEERLEGCSTCPSSSSRAALRSAAAGHRRGRRPGAVPRASRTSRARPRGLHRAPRASSATPPTRSRSTTRCSRITPSRRWRSRASAAASRARQDTMQLSRAADALAPVVGDVLRRRARDGRGRAR